MHIHILGICGTFMGSLAILAKQMGHQVSGCDANVYPPMSTQLSDQGIELMQGFDASHLNSHPDLVVVGNAMSRGNPVVEAVLNKGLPYTSGPQWLQEHVLKDKWVLAAAGTHGKTTTSSMLAWILEYAGLKPGFLIGGVPKNFSVSAQLGGGSFFVVEADEYDSAFFDKRSKFIHYRPRTVILNNLEFDHADIFPDLAAIQRQFHHLVRTVPSEGLIIYPQADSALSEVMDMGCWTPCQRVAVTNIKAEAEIEPHVEAHVNNQPNHWQAVLGAADGSQFKVLRLDEEGIYTQEGEIDWSQTGMHNVNNALVAIAAARHVGIATNVSTEALCQFEGVKRRMEKLAVVSGNSFSDITVFDDFAHHPTAIASTLAGLRAKLGQQGRIIAIIEPRSNTMRMGVHAEQLLPSAGAANLVFWYQPKGMDWDLQGLLKQTHQKHSVGNATQSTVFESTSQIIAAVLDQARSGDNIVIMSNGGFDGIHQKLIQALRQETSQ